MIIQVLGCIWEKRERERERERERGRLVEIIDWI
jgi:hypothetical protein